MKLILKSNDYLIFVALSIIPFFWWDNALNFAEGDNSLYANFYMFTKQSLFSWVDNFGYEGLGSRFPNRSFLFFYFIYELLFIFTENLGLILKIILSISILASSIALNKLLNNFQLNFFPRVFSVIYYIINLYNGLFFINYHHHLLLIYLPIFFLCCYKISFELDKKYISILALSSILMMPVFDNPPYVIQLIFIPISFIFFCLLNYEYKKSFLVVWYFTLSFIATLFLWIWILVPFYDFMTQNNTIESINLNVTVTNGSGIFDNFRFLRQWAFNEKVSNHSVYYNNPLIIFSSYILVLITYICIFNLKSFSSKKKKIIIIILIINLLYLFLSKGTRMPFGSIYEHLFENISYFKIFREPYTKFTNTYVFTSVLLFSFSIELIFKKYKNYFHLFVIFLSIVATGKPFITAEFINSQKSYQLAKNKSAFHEIPKYYKDLNDFLDTDIKDQSSRLALFPQVSTFQMWKKGANINSLPYLIINHNTLVYDSNKIENQKDPVAVFYKKFLLNEDITSDIKKLNIRYLIVLEDQFIDDSKKNDLFYFSHNDIINMIKKFSFFTEIARFDQITVFKLDNAISTNLAY